MGLARRLGYSFATAWAGFIPLRLIGSSQICVISRRSIVQTPRSYGYRKVATRLWPREALNILLSRGIDIVIPGVAGVATSVSIHLERWIDPTKLGWYPGEPHIHPEGQIYGIVSKFGLTPETLLRQVRGEASGAAGSVLIWTCGIITTRKQFLKPPGHVYAAQYRLPFTGYPEC